MSTVIRTEEPQKKQLNQKEAYAFFEKAVHERLGISADEFLRQPERFKASPHYDSLMFLLPLTNASQ
jgi:hypothetical protein